MRNTCNWKHVTKQRHQFGMRYFGKYKTPFMVLDPKCLKGDKKYRKTEVMWEVVI